MPLHQRRTNTSITVHSSATTQDSLNIFQHNCCGSNLVFLYLFSNLKTLKPDIVAVQDPFLFKDKPLNTPGFTLIYDHSSRIPKVATYISNPLLKSASYITNPSRYPNILSITIYINNSPFQVVKG